ncbi:MAG: hypothetical protein ABGX83_05210 [Nitrospira sp.]
MARYIRKISEAKAPGEKYPLEEIFIWTQGLWDRGDMVDVQACDVIFPVGKEPSTQPDSPEDYISVSETVETVSPNVVVQDVHDGPEKKEQPSKVVVADAGLPKVEETKVPPKIDPNEVDPNRLTLIKQAMEGLMPEDFIKATSNYSSRPSTEVLTTILGLEVFSKERDMAWDQVKDQYPEISDERGVAKSNK